MLQDQKISEDIQTLPNTASFPQTMGGKLWKTYG